MYTQTKYYTYKPSYKNKYLISACFFSLNKPYKNFKIYIEGLQRILKSLIKKGGFIFRLYYDESVDKYIKNIKKESKIKDRLQLVKINHNYYNTTFMTLLRFIPFFDDEKYKLFLISDIDSFILNYKNIFNNIRIINNNNINILVEQYNYIYDIDCKWRLRNS